MSTFIGRVVSSIIEKHDDFNQVLIVVPNQRAGLYIQQSIAQQLGKTVFAPRILTVQQFIQESSGRKLINPVMLQFLCYEAYLKSINNIQHESFATFLNWSGTLLADFNEIDHHLLPAREVFSNLAAIKEIDEWSFQSQDSLSAGQQLFQNFWKLFFPIYQELHKLLTEQHAGYAGALSKLVAEHPEKLNQWKNSHLYFVGINALTRAEEHILKTCKKTLSAHFYWDVDDYYFTPKYHEAGVFLRRYANSWAPEIKDQLQHRWAKQKNIYSYEVNGYTAQAKLAGKLLNDFQGKNDNFNQTALVLADEKLLIPVLTSLPNDIAGANLTLGYPSEQSTTFHFFIHLFALQEYFQKHSSTHIPYRWLIKLLSLPLSKKIFGNKKVTDAEQHINQENLVLINPALLHKLLCTGDVQNSLLNLMLKKWEHLPETCLNSWQKICSILFDLLSEELDKEFIYLFHQVLKNLNALDKHKLHIQELKTLKTLFKKLIKKEQIPFYGEPLSGLQIMGMLETRALSFDKIILLSLNEGTLPSDTGQNSFIPKDLKKHYQLPTSFEKNAIYAYHFYRLLQHSNEIHLIYNGSTESVNANEKSRFLTQLEIELPYAIQHHNTTTSFKLSNEEHSIILSEEDITSMKYLFEDVGLSATSINTYFNCPLNFYHKYLLNIQEPSEVEEIIEANAIGTIAHLILEEMLSPTLNKVLQKEYLLSQKSKIPTLVDQAFQKAFPQAKFDMGPNYIAKKVVCEQVDSFINRQVKELNDLPYPLTIIGLEERFEKTIELNGIQLKIKGTIDRIDSIGNTIRIIDYKSGKFEKESVSIRSGTQKNHHIPYQLIKSGADKANQLAFYFLGADHCPSIQNNTSNQSYELTAGMIGLNNIGEDLVATLNFKGESIVFNQSLEEHLIDSLQELVTELLTPNKVLKHNKNSTYCLVC